MGISITAARMTEPAPIIPLSEPPWLSGAPSPYYDDSHRRVQAACREFIHENLGRHALEWETAEGVPSHVYGTFAKAGYLLPSLPCPLPVEWLKKVGVPPLLHYGDKQLQERYIPDLLTGEIRTCIAITEPEAGSDVANITTTAELSKCGKFYLVNGSKKWITNGIWADYATMAVRTGAEDSGARGISMLFVPLSTGTKGVMKRRIKVAGQISAGTTYIELDDVKVPRENLIGQEGMGMKYIMNNFNHERLFISIGTTRQARVALSAAFECCMKREAFGKTLMEQPVVRHRLAKCAAILEAQQAWVESFVYQMTQLPKAKADRDLGGLTALCKANAGIVLDECARCAVLLFGGNGFTRSGQGEIAEKIYRDVPGARIPGGSEDVLLDLAIRQMVKNFQDKTKAIKASRL